MEAGRYIIKHGLKTNCRVMILELQVEKVIIHPVPTASQIFNCLWKNIIIGEKKMTKKRLIEIVKMVMDTETHFVCPDHKYWGGDFRSRLIASMIQEEGTIEAANAAARKQAEATVKAARIQATAMEDAARRQATAMKDAARIQATAMKDAADTIYSGFTSLK